MTARGAVLPNPVAGGEGPSVGTTANTTSAGEGPAAGTLRSNRAKQGKGTLKSPYDTIMSTAAQSEACR